MAKDLNKVMIIGRLGADPEMRYTPSGSPVTTFRVATSRQWKDGNGEAREETEWFSAVAWNKLAEICNQYLTKGTRVYLEGRLQTRSWDDQQSGQTRYRTEVIASDMIILDGRENRDSRAPRDADDDYLPPRDTPRSPSRSGSGPGTSSGGGSGSGGGGGNYSPPQPDIGDEDIPF